MLTATEAAVPLPPATTLRRSRTAEGAPRNTEARSFVFLDEYGPDTRGTAIREG
jgi:hypothetical protein